MSRLGGHRPPLQETRSTSSVAVGFDKDRRVSLETVSAIAQIIAAIGVIASLFYLAVQVRQNTRSMRAVVVDSLAGALVDLFAPLAHDPSVMRAFIAVVESWDAASEEDRVRAVPIMFGTFKLFENAWFQKRQGTLDPEQWEGWDVYIRIYYHRPGVKTWWLMRRAAFAAGFRHYLESSQPVEAVPSLDELIHGKP